MDHQSEIELIYQVITHPAGFDVVKYSTLTIHRLEWEQSTWAVAWENYFSPHDDMKNEWEELIIPSALEAAQCFVELRHKMLIGLDLEEQEEPHTSAYYRLNDTEIAELKKRYNTK